VVTYNLGEIAEMAGDTIEARRRYEEGQSLSKAMGFEEGLKQCGDALKRLAKS